MVLEPTPHDADRRPRRSKRAGAADACRCADSLFLSLQAVLSNGCGASVGLEAAYAQMGAAIASFTGGAFNFRRSDLRTFVGAGAGAGIAAAFGAPLTGAFYAFEIIMGLLTPSPTSPRWSAPRWRALGRFSAGADRS